MLVLCGCDMIHIRRIAGEQHAVAQVTFQFPECLQHMRLTIALRYFLH